MKKLYIYITLVSLGLLTSCLDEISPDFEFEEQVFISGLLTTETGFVSVQVQKTVQVTDTTFSPVNNAQVSLFTRDASNTVSLVSDSFTVIDGIYQTSAIITPIIGNTYWIEVILQNQTVLTSEEEILRPVQIIDMVKNENKVQITFIGPAEEQNFYLFRLEVLKDGLLITDEWTVFSDRFINEGIEKKLNIINIIEDGHTVRISLHNLNFNTFQFYVNVLGTADELFFASLFSPANIVGNVTNTTTNKLALGNFGIAGFSTMTMDF